MLKSNAELNKLPADSTDCFKLGMIDRYAKRPAEIENVCLADFIACFTFKSKGRSNQDEEDTVDGDDNPADNDDDQDFGNENEVAQGRRQPAIQLEDGKLIPRKHPKVIRFCRYDIRKEPKEFFRERLMLFKPWRNEHVELEIDNTEEVFNQNRDLITSNSSKYIKLDINIDEIVQQMINNRETEAADTWDAEVNPDHVNEYEPDDNVPEPNIEFDSGRDATLQIATKKYSLPGRLNDEEYYELCSSLNEKQKEYLMHIYNAIKTSKEAQYHFVSGGAGVGKSRLIKAIFQTLIRFYNKDEGPAGKVQVALIAPTGKAAHGIGGETAHHFFNLKFGGDGNADKFVPPSAEKLNTMRTDLPDLRVILIDEISMMGYRTLNSIHMTLNLIYKNNDPNRIFGNRSVIAFGDFNQLQPVKDSFCFTVPSRNPLSTIAGNIIWLKFKLFELTEIMRQREDGIFAEILNRLAVGASTDEDMKMLNDRIFTEESLPTRGKLALRLAWSNKDVETYNLQRIVTLLQEKPDTRYKNNEAVDTFPTDISPQVKRQILANLKDRPAAKTHGLPENLWLQIGVHYMVSSNVDVSDGLCNGAIGILRDFITDHQGQVTKVYLEFDEPSVGKKARKGNSSLINPLWTPLLPVKVSFSVTRKYTDTVRIIVL